MNTKDIPITKLQSLVLQQQRRILELEMKLRIERKKSTDLESSIRYKKFKGDY